MDATRKSTLTMENIRCFSRETIEFRPLTILLGENSTGKTTTLGCHQTTQSILGEVDKDNTCVPFNQVPHEMGIFNKIIRGPVEHQRSDSENDGKIVLTHKFDQLVCKSWYVEGFQKMPEIEKISLSIPGSENMSLELKLTDEHIIAHDKLNGSNSLSITVPRQLVVSKDMGSYLSTSVLAHMQNIVVNGNTKPTSIIKQIIENIYSVLPNNGLVAISARKPSSKRVYDFAEDDKSDEDKLPYLLYELWQKERHNFNELISKINRFGVESKAFKDFDLRIDEADGNEFEITAVRDGKRVSVHDMGTGIWPALYQLLIVEAESFSKHTQQFHVQHLEEYSHPRLHASFIKWLCEKTNEGNSFVVETHSDYALMRLTIEICDKKINAEDIAVAYFEHDSENNRSKIHNLSYDDRGIIVDAPDSYREFYYDETEKYVLASNRP